MPQLHIMDDSLLHILSDQPVVHFKKDTLILSPSQLDDKCYVVSKGLVKVTSQTREGEEVRIIYGKGELFPVSWIMGKPLHSAFFRAQTDCSLIEIPQEKLRSLAMNSSSIAWSLLQRITAQFVIYTARVDNFRYKYSRERLAYRLLFLEYRFGEISPEDRAVLLPAMNQQDLGDTIHATRESVNRELKRFMRLKLIEYRQGQIAVLDKARLRKELGNDVGNLFFDSASS